MRMHFVVTGFGPHNEELSLEIVDRDDIIEVPWLTALLGDETVGDDLDLVAGEYELNQEQSRAILERFGHTAMPEVEYFIGRRGPFKDGE